METHVTVAIVVEKGGKFLLVKRRDKPEKGFWAVPGGHVEKGEQPVGAARREAMEEVGEIAIAKGPAWSFVHDVGLRKRHKCHVFLGKAAGRIRAGSDAARLGWFTPRQMENLDLTNYTLQIFNRLYRRNL
ncbi:MAG: NUDIX domain-containing protein [Candidatus Aenigmarchaeota archaeon]|nr:NUDIX domain-containing protein [Candidatus Aenigmarchaeota archaeon]